MRSINGNWSRQFHHADGGIAALFRFHDEPRTESSAFVRHLRPNHQASQIIILSGYRQSEVEHLARIVGIEQIYAGITPEEKLKLISEATQHRKTLLSETALTMRPPCSPLPPA